MYRSLRLLLKLTIYKALDVIAIRKRVVNCLLCCKIPKTVPCLLLLGGLRWSMHLMIVFMVGEQQLADPFVHLLLP